MEKVLLYEKAISILNERYDFIKRLIVAGDRDVALSLYHTLFDKLDFMFELGLVEFDEYTDLIGYYNNFFDIHFLS